MFDHPFSLKKKKDGSAVYSVAFWYRILMGAVCVLIASAFIAYGEMPNIIGWAFLGFSLIDALYDERWSVNPSTKLIVFHVGVAGIGPRYKTPFDSVVSINLEPFTKGSAAEPAKGDLDIPKKRRHLRFRLIIVTNDETKVIDITRSGGLSRLEDTGRAIASIAEKPFNNKVDELR